MALGRQRRHARKPAVSASCGLGKNGTFSRRGRLDGHDGRQYTPGDETAKTNLPSLAPSRPRTACQRESSIMLFIFSCGGGIVLFMIGDDAVVKIWHIRIFRSHAIV